MPPSRLHGSCGQEFRQKAELEPGLWAGPHELTETSGPHVQRRYAGVRQAWKSPQGLCNDASWRLDTPRAEQQQKAGPPEYLLARQAEPACAKPPRRDYPACFRPGAVSLTRPEQTQSPCAVSTNTCRQGFQLDKALRLR